MMGDLHHFLEHGNNRSIPRSGCFFVFAFYNFFPKILRPLIYYEPAKWAAEPPQPIENSHTPEDPSAT